MCVSLWRGCVDTGYAAASLISNSHAVRMQPLALPQVTRRLYADNTLTSDSHAVRSVSPPQLNCATNAGQQRKCV
jgi:hypothetical protein